MTDPGSPSRPSASIGAAIRRARAGRFTLVQLAKRSRTSSGLLSLIERGQGNPSYETMGRIAEALSIPLTRLLEMADEGDPNTTDKLVETRALAPTGGALDRVAAGLFKTGHQEPVAEGWQTSMVLERGQEARVRVLGGSLELRLRDPFASIASEGIGRSLAIDLEIRTVGEPGTIGLPPVDDPRWMRIIDGTRPFQPSTLAGRMLFTHVVRCVRQDPASPVVERWVRELRGYFAKYESVSRADIARIVG